MLHERITLLWVRTQCGSAPVCVDRRVTVTQFVLCPTFGSVCVPQCLLVVPERAYYASVDLSRITAGLFCQLYDAPRLLVGSAESR